MTLKEKYAGLVDAAAQHVKNLTVSEDAGKLHLKGNVPYKMDSDAVWAKIKTYPDWQKEVAATLPAEKTDIYGVYTVKSGDTLSALANAHLGDPKRYMEIFNLNTDVLTDPNAIKVGQKLKLPVKA